jgi:hypothetical protein
VTNPLLHPDQSYSSTLVARGRVKTPAIVTDAKIHTTHVRNEFDVNSLRLTMFNDVAKSFLGDSK